MHIRQLENIRKTCQRSSANLFTFSQHGTKAQMKFIPRTFSTAFVMEKAHKNSESATKCIKLKRVGEF